MHSSSILSPYKYYVLLTVESINKPWQSHRYLYCFIKELLTENAVNSKGYITTHVMIMFISTPSVHKTVTWLHPVSELINSHSLDKEWVTGKVAKLSTNII